MKKILATVLVLFTLLSCEKKEVEVDYAPTIAGDYVGVALEVEGNAVQLPYNGVRASIIVVRTGVNTVKFRSNLTVPGSSPVSLDLDCKVNYTQTRTTLVEPTTSLDIAWLENGILVHKITGQNIYIYAKK
jgi:hypothetical protein